MTWRDDNYVYCTQYINRWGKLMVASHYGYKAWRIPIKRRR